MTWLAVKIFLDNSFLWCKKYWQILLGAGIAISVMILSAGRRNDLKKALELANKKSVEDKDAMQRSHDAQIRAERQKSIEQREHAESLARKISEIEKSHRVDSSALSKRKRRQLEVLLDEDSDPSDISEGLADIFGTDIKS